MSKTVRIYDLVTKRTTTIPAVELAPGMVEADVTGVGRVWIKAAQTKNGEYRHAPFDDSLRDFVKNEIQQPLAEVHPKTIAEWEDGFRRDAEPEREIAIWCRLAERLVEFSKSEGLDKCNGGNVSQ